MKWLQGHHRMRLGAPATQAVGSKTSRNLVLTTPQFSPVGKKRLGRHVVFCRGRLTTEIAFVPVRHPSLGPYLEADQPLRVGVAEGGTAGRAGGRLQTWALCRHATNRHWLLGSSAHSCSPMKNSQAETSQRIAAVSLRKGIICLALIPYPTFFL